MEVEELKIGDELYTFRSSLMNKFWWKDYNTHKIISETKNHWRMSNGYLVRKTDLMIRGNFEYMHLIDDRSKLAKQKRIDYNNKK